MRVAERVVVCVEKIVRHARTRARTRAPQKFVSDFSGMAKPPTPFGVEGLSLSDYLTRA